jgi:hypothetical protein
MARSWFGEALLPRLQFRDIPQSEAIAILSEEVGVGPHYRDQLEIVLQYLEACNLVGREDGLVKLGVNSLTVPPFNGQPKPDASVQDTPRPAESAASAPKAQPPAQPEYALNVTFDIQVPMDALSTWSPDRIASLFAGVAQALAAKNGGQATNQQE